MVKGQNPVIRHAGTRPHLNLTLSDASKLMDAWTVKEPSGGKVMTLLRERELLSIT